MQNRTHLQSDPKQQELRIREGFFEGLKNVRNNFKIWTELKTIKSENCDNRVKKV